MKKLILLLFVFLPFFLSNAQPKSEIRAIWLTTNYGLDWPSEKSAAAQQKELQNLLDQLQTLHFNTIIFQVQCRSDVFWQSSYQPWSRYLTGVPGKDPGYDVLRFAIDECHKRNMEIHAWIVPFPLGSNATVNYYGDAHVTKTHPELCLYHGSEWFLDPGLPATTDYLIDVYSELVDKYDFDGINLDYTRYPNNSFPDDQSYAQHGNGANRNEWRRQNVNRFVHALYDMIQEKKPGMKLGAAPVGAYESLPDAPSGFTAHTHLFQDPIEWVNSDKLDLVIPQVYWTTYYEPQLKNWIKKSGNRPVVAGLAAYKMLPPDDGENWAASVITGQIDKARETGSAGICFFRTKQITGNLKNIYTLLQQNQFCYPANIPPMDWYGTSQPGAPQNLTVTHKKDGTYRISWDTPDTQADAPIRYYCLYTGENPDINIDDVKNIAVHGIPGNSVEYTVPEESKEYYFTVTAFDKGYYESQPSVAVSTNGSTGFIENDRSQTRFTRMAGQWLISSETPISEVRLYTINGIMIGQTGYNDREAIVNTGILAPGMYIIVVRLTDGTVVKHKTTR